MAFELEDHPPAPAPVAAPGRLGRNIAALASGQAVTWTMAVAWTLVVPRALGPNGMGLIVSAWAVAGIFGIVLGFGGRVFLVRELVPDLRRADQLLGTALVLRALTGPLFAVGVVAYAVVAVDGSEARLVLYLAGAATFLTLLAEPLQAGFQAIERMEFLAYADVVNKTGQALLGIALALLGFASTAIVGAWVVAAGAALLLEVLWLRGRLRVDLRTTPRRLLGMARASAAYWAFGVFYTVYLWVDAVMLSLLASSEAVGWYGVPMRLFQTLMFVPVVLSTAWLPRLVTAFEHGGTDALKRAARRPIELVLVVGLPIAAATAALADPGIHLLYGGAYAESVPVMVVLGLCIPPMYLNIMLSQVVVAAGQQSSWTRAMVVATLLNPLLNLFLIRATAARFDNPAIGAALALFVTEIAICTVGFWLVGGNVVDSRVVARCLRAALASGVLWAVGWAAAPLGLAPSLALMAVAFAAAALATGLVRADDVRRALDRARRRRASGDPTLAVDSASGPSARSR